MKHIFQLVLIVLLLGCIPWSIYPFELLMHFRGQCAVLSGVAVLYYFARRERLLLPAAAVFVYYVMELVPFLIPYATVPAAGVTLNVLAANVSVSNSKSAAIVRLAESVDADIVALSEVRPEFLAALEPLKHRYPHVLPSPATLPSGPVFFSKHPIVRGSFDSATNHLQAVLDVRGVEVSVFYVTSPPPISPEHLARRDYNLDVVAKTVATLAMPVVVLGDFNAGPWSPVFERFAETADLLDARLGRGLYPTFPAFLSSLGIPIDHCLAGKGLRPTGFRSITVPGSDHRGVVCDVVRVN